MKVEDKQDIVLPYLEKILEFAARCGQDSIIPARRSDGVVKALVALLGDLGVFVGSYAVPLLSQPFVQQLISECSQDEDTVEIARYTRDVRSSHSIFFNSDVYLGDREITTRKINDS